MSEETKAPRRSFPFVLKLATPVQFGSETIAELVFRKGTLGDGKGLKLKDELSTDQLVTIAARLCGQPTNVIEMLDIDDGGEVMDISLDFYVRYLGRKRP